MIICAHITNLIYNFFFFENIRNNHRQQLFFSTQQQRKPRDQETDNTHPSAELPAVLHTRRTSSSAPPGTLTAPGSCTARAAEFTQVYFSFPYSYINTISSPFLSFQIRIFESTTTLGFSAIKFRCFSRGIRRAGNGWI